jgi:hypothetical protein
MASIIESELPPDSPDSPDPPEIDLLSIQLLVA